MDYFYLSAAVLLFGADVNALLTQPAPVDVVPNGGGSRLVFWLLVCNMLRETIIGVRAMEPHQRRVVVEHHSRAAARPCMFG